MERVLVTGGAGFIGSHLARALVKAGHDVRVLDNMTAQVHDGAAPVIDEGVELVVADVRNGKALAQALEDVDAVVHLAARVGVGQSMYEFSEYLDENCYGTAALMRAAIGMAPRRVVVASSMSLYGEGRYRTADGAFAEAARTREQLLRREWEPQAEDGTWLVPVATDERKPAVPGSIYALTKLVQEQVVLQLANAYGLSAIALRFFNVYGPGQALSNPYTGALAIFASRLLNGNPPVIYEDGEQLRDFVSVHDVVQAILLALEPDAPDGKAYNIGSGMACSVQDVCWLLSKELELLIEPELPGTYRVGDVRHCFADISRAVIELGYEPQVPLEQGIRELVPWLRDQTPVDRGEAAAEELRTRGLVR